MPVVLTSTARLNLILTAIATWVQKRFVGEKKIDVQKAATGVDQDTP